ncbi:MAG: ABC transporter substrate-binding protein [Chloroflexota bacterium]
MDPVRRGSRLFAVVAVMALIATACGGSSATPAPTPAATGAAPSDGGGATSAPASAPGTPTMGGKIVTAIEGEPASVDPAFDYDFVSGLATSSITEPLLIFCENDTKVCPNLAESYTISADGLTYTLKLRQGVQFSDGTPMTVEDVVFSLNRIRDPQLASYVGWMLGKVKDVQAPDATTVVITLTEPDALFEYALASTAAHVVNKAFVTKAGKDYGTPAVGSIGTGPFKLAEWKTGDYQKLVRNDNYWNKANGGPYLDEITIKILPEPTTRVAGLQTGEIDYLINNVPSDQFATVQQIDSVNLSFIPSYYGEWITFNTQAAPFNNVKVRQAMNYAFDKKSVRQLYYGADALDTKSTLVNPTLWTFEKDAWQAAWDKLPSYDQDLEKAKALLAESGVADQLNGKTIAYYESTPSVKGAAEAFIADMAKIGINIEARKVTYQESVSMQFGEHTDYDIFLGSWGSDFPDASGNLRPNFASENTVAGGANSSNYKNPAVDKLLAEQNTLPNDKAKRAALMIQAQALIAEDSAVIVTAYPGWPLAVNKRLGGVEAASLWYWQSLFKNLYIKP